MKFPASGFRKCAAAAVFYVLAALLSVEAKSPAPPIANPAEAPAKDNKYTAEVAKLAAAPQPAPGGILMVGSSIFRKWTTATADFAPLPITNRAFGGSKTADQVFFFDQIVPSSHAALVVWYCGSNDANSKTTSPDVTLQNTRDWVAKTKAALPGVHIIIVSVIRSPQKRDAGLLDKVNELNRGLLAIVAADPSLTFVDVNPSLETPDGQAVVDYYVKDRLHLSPEGYARMTNVMRPVLEKEWKTAVAAAGR